MDHERFDRLARHLATGANRRGILKGLVGGATAVVAGGALRQRTMAEETAPAFCNEFHPCTDPNVATCGTTGATANRCCRTTIGMYCDADANIGNACCDPKYVCAAGTTWENTGGGNPPDPTKGCQCATGYVTCGGTCINESHCCTNEQPGCPSGQTCTTDSNGHYTCTAIPVECVAVGGTCNQYHLCCHPDQVHCSASGTETGTCVANEVECVAVDKPCNTFHPCCHPDQYVCSSTTETPGTCEKIEVECVAVGGTCNQYHPCCHADKVHCTSTTTQAGTCVENEETCGANKQRCAAPGYRSKCCPVGHQCHPHERSKTFDCRAATNTNGGGGKKNGKQNHKRGRKK